MVFSVNIPSSTTTIRSICKNHKNISTNNKVKLTEIVFKIRTKSQFSNTNLIKEKTNLWFLYDCTVDIFWSPIVYTEHIS